MASSPPVISISFSLYGAEKFERTVALSPIKVSIKTNHSIKKKVSILLSHFSNDCLCAHFCAFSTHIQAMFTLNEL